MYVECSCERDKMDMQNYLMSSPTACEVEDGYWMWIYGGEVMGAYSSETETGSLCDRSNREGDREWSVSEYVVI